jgi:hypothetical protein
MSNAIMETYYPLFELYQRLRIQWMDLLTDEDLSFTPGGANLTLGELCREIGEVERAYIESFKSFSLDFSYRNPTPGLSDSVAMLKSWYAVLDQELRETVAALSDEDVQRRTVDRGGNFRLPPQIQLDVYKEALLIFYGKASVYLKMMDKPLPHQWQEWIA